MGIEEIVLDEPERVIGLLVGLIHLDLQISQRVRQCVDLQVDEFKFFAILRVQEETIPEETPGGLQGSPEASMVLLPEEARTV